jgi:penicillin amidase
MTETVANEKPAVEPRPAAGRSKVRRAARLAAVALAAAAVLAVVLGTLLYRAVAASRPLLAGELVVAGLAAPVTVERDGLGVPTVRGANRLDVARALGFLHAQDRFFQMDLSRRQAAGELAELVGPTMVDADRSMRVHRFRSVARAVVERSSLAEQALLDAYATGVNAGLAALPQRPFEYLLLRSRPAPWRAEDSVLVLLAMFNMLNTETRWYDATVATMTDTLPPALVDFLVPPGTTWDSPLVGGPLPEPPLPGPDVVDLRTKQDELPRAAARGEVERLPAGSNNWAIAGSRTRHGGAILANDMHLLISVPNTWYRASLVWPSGSGERRVTGVTLPGAPAVVVGSNGDVAWGFTNSYGDWLDLVTVEEVAGDPGAYRTPGGIARFDVWEEKIAVRGGDEQRLEVETTVWGPVIGRDARGRRRALRWLAHDPQAVNFSLVRLEAAADLDEALLVAADSGIPPQNFVGADRTGRIGWTIAGRIPRRSGPPRRGAVAGTDPAAQWQGFLRPEEYPKIVDPGDGLLWTANARTVDGGWLEALGNGGYYLGIRAAMIRERLGALERPSELDMLALQLDDRAAFLERWRELVLRTLTAEATAGRPERAEFRRLVDTGWTGRASVDSVGYRLVRGFRAELLNQVYKALTAPCRAADPEFGFGSVTQAEGSLWRLVTERPPHLLDPRFASWDDQLLAAVDAVIVTLTSDGTELGERTWGERNRAAMRHPLSLAVPLLSRFLDMPRDPLPGDGFTPRAQGPGFGASERMAVSPGREQDGYFHMPGGQSGHPLSPYYRAGHDAWVRGEPTPFLPGPTVHTLELRPAP